MTRLQHIMPTAHDPVPQKPTRRLRTHGLSRTPEYRAWQQLRLRCTDPNHTAWPDYGGRGITVCAAWLDSPQQFLADMGPKPTPKHELDRRDNNGPYSPDNCRWVVRKANCRNRRSNTIIELSGERLTLVEWSERCGLPATVIHKRLKSGGTTHEALHTPVRPKAPKGQAKRLHKFRCVTCGAPTGATLCKPCANRANNAKRQELRRAA